MEAQGAGCSKDYEGISSNSSLGMTALIGDSGAGKTSLLNSTVRQAADTSYLPHAMDLDPAKVRAAQQCMVLQFLPRSPCRRHAAACLPVLQLCAEVALDLSSNTMGLIRRPLEYDPREAQPDFLAMGDCPWGAAFASNGTLVDSAAVLGAADAADQRLADAVVSGKAVCQAQQEGCLLPIYRSSSSTGAASAHGVTTPYNAVMCRASKARLLLVCFTRRMLQGVVRACQAQLQRQSELAQLSPDAMAFLAVSRPPAHWLVLTSFCSAAARVVRLCHRRQLCDALCGRPCLAGAV